MSGGNAVRLSFRNPPVRRSPRSLAAAKFRPLPLTSLASPARRRQLVERLPPDPPAPPFPAPSQPRMSDAEMALEELRRKYKIMEGNRKSYVEDAQNHIRRQRQTIDTLKQTLGRIAH